MFHTAGSFLTKMQLACNTPSLLLIRLWKTQNKTRGLSILGKTRLWSLFVELYYTCVSFFTSLYVCSVIVEAVKMDSLQKLCSTLEPLLRRVVSISCPAYVDMTWQILQNRLC